MNVHIHVEAVAKSSYADSMKMNDSMLGAELAFGGREGREGRCRSGRAPQSLDRRDEDHAIPAPGDTQFLL